MRTVRVNASRSYDVIIGNGLIGKAGEYISAVAKSKKAVIVSDDNVYPLYGEALISSLSASGISAISYVFPHGEESKNLSTYSKILEYMCENRINRGDFIITLGGGVTGDMAGFAAATYQRGIGFVQMPTTLLSDVDSSVGGKTAVDLNAGKNQVGCFYQPMLVLCDTGALNTLPDAEYENGCAEVIKYGVIGSEKLFHELDKAPVSSNYEEIIARCVEMKRDFVEKDERDTGDRIFLNFGHTFAHAIELLSGYEIPHGRAVAIGMAIMARAAHKLGFCGGEDADRLLALIKKYDLPTQTRFSAEALANAALSDKKANDRGVKLVIPEKIGLCRVHQASNDEMLTWAKAGI